jgi:hypothetical protein
MNGVTPEKLISAIRENITRKGAVWSGQPGFRGKEMDLCKLFSTCISAGGFDHVSIFNFFSIDPLPILPVHCLVD